MDLLTRQPVLWCMTCNEWIEYASTSHREHDRFPLEFGAALLKQLTRIEERLVEIINRQEPSGL